MKKIILLAFIFLINLNASYEKGREVFLQNCVSCHIESIPLNVVMDNFKNHNNKLLNLVAPPFNRIEYKILRSQKAIGTSEDDIDMRTYAIEDYLKDYLTHPRDSISLLSKRSRSDFEIKIPRDDISDEQYHYLAEFIMQFKENHKENLYKDNSKLNDKQIIKKAKKQNKYILVEATSSNCYYCKKMNKEVFTLDEVKQKLNKNYIFIKANVDKTKLPFNLEKIFLKVTPSFFFLDENAKVIKMYPGAWNKKDFLNILDEHKKNNE